jgi:outer membrane protein
VDYAMQNSISVKQADVQARIAALQTKLANAQAYPNLLFNTQLGINSGRSIDPTSNLYTTNQVFFQSLGLQSGVTLFNFFSIKNNRLSARLDEEAYKTGIDRARNDIALNVAASYLQYLLSIEQANITKIQIQQTRSQLDNTRKLVDAGSMPELNAAQLEAQLAKDSSNYITAKGTADQNRISLMGLLNLDASASFEAATPDVDKIPIEPLAELEPAFVYNLALTTQPLQKKDSLHIKAAEYAVKSARGAMYPTLSAFVALNSNYASTYNQFTGLQPTGKFDTVAIVPVGGTNYYALTPGYNTITSKVPYFKQVSDINFSQAIGIQLNIPIANNRQLRNNYERAKLDVENLRLQLNQDNITLQQNIYTAYSNAVSALEKYNANIKAYKIQQYAFELSKKRYEIGVLSTIDYITTQNNLFSAEIDQVSAKYDYIFKMKVLEFYKGQGVKL